MTRVPFATDSVKLDYLRNIAVEKMCKKCSQFNQKGCSALLLSDLKRNKIDDVQDLFEIKYSCSRELASPIEISKFFIPNRKFEEYYMNTIIETSQNQFNVNGKKILNDVLSWGRLNVN